MGKRQRELEAFQTEINNKIEELDRQGEIDKAEADAVSKLSTVGAQYGDSGFYRGGVVKDLKAFSEDMDPTELTYESSSTEGKQDNVNKLWSQNTQATFGNLSGAISDPNATTLNDMLGSTEVEQLYA
jgi:hypothetical protein